jgi:hypothetical protein
MNIPKATKVLSRDEVVLALSALGEDPSARRVDQLLEIVDASGLQDGDGHGEMVRAAVDTARQKLDASAGQKITEPRLVVGNWMHTWSWDRDGRSEAQCRIVVDLTNGRLIAAQVGGYEGWSTATPDEKDDLAASLFNRNPTVLADPKTFDLVQIDRLPKWAADALDASPLEPYRDGEVLGLDKDGHVVEWNARTEMPVESGQSLAEFGLQNLREDELVRVGVPREEWEAAFAGQGRVARPHTLEESVDDIGLRIGGLRKALRDLIGATATASSKAAISAQSAAYEAYRKSLSTDEKQRVVLAALEVQRNAPDGHFIRNVDLRGNFEIAVRELGMNLVFSVLDSVPEEPRQKKSTQGALTVPADTLRWLLDQAMELKDMKVEINGDYSPEDLSVWDARLAAVERIVQVPDTAVKRVSKTEFPASTGVPSLEM